MTTDVIAPEFRVTRHLREQAASKGIAIETVLSVLRHPLITYPSFVKDERNQRVPMLCRSCGAQQQKWTGVANGQKVCVTVFPCCGVATTVWFDQIETEVRADQRQAGLTGYVGMDGRWRSA